MDTKRTGGRRLRRVLFATDRTASSRAALLAVGGLATGGGTGVVVLHVDDAGRPRESEELAAEVACGMIALAVDARSEVRRAPRGEVAAAIAVAAAEHCSDLVVLGSRGRSDLGGLLLGPVGREVLARVSCPVLLVRAGRRATTGRRRRLLLAVAGDEDLDDLVRTTAAVAEHDSRVLVLHVPAPGGDQLQFALSEQLVERMVAGLRRCGVRARGRARARAAGHGPADEIARTALGYGADLVVMGSRRLPELTGLLRGGGVHPRPRPEHCPRPMGTT